MPPVPSVVAQWHDFYTVVGEASATLTGLLFVAASVGSGIFTRDRPGALRMFLSASVTQFGSTLASSLVILAPHRAWRVPGILILGLGLFGLLYSALAWRGAARDGIIPKIDWDDRVWYAAVPVAAYLLQAASGTLLLTHPEAGCATLAVAVGCLLLTAIHNAWDMTIWSITRRQD